jgi:hypothetical protein
MIIVFFTKTKIPNKSKDLFSNFYLFRIFMLMNEKYKISQSIYLEPELNIKY